MSTVIDGWDVPEGLGDWTDWHWWKVPAGKCLTLVLLSEQPTGYVGHYYKGRMIPCLGDGCKLCEEGIGGQARYVFVAAQAEDRKVGLIEVSRSVALDWKEVADAVGTAKGLTVCIWKKSYSKHSRMEYEFQPTPQGLVVEAFTLPDVKWALKQTWEKAGFPLPDVIANYRQPKVSSSSRGFEKPKERPQKGPEEAKKRFMREIEAKAP